ncbi:hypothetical protein BC008_00105 [Mastigocoleus testarum BC008]|uniref:Uncharacterized protein n=1 Tax=Mastigocoleus testarum BC008 TaxID=371196 RepID=A0A0V7ZTU9_9CYAN|nr:hypothetical protein BC008_00105 [Mastigocoleus testarum BC008]
MIIVANFALTDFPDKRHQTINLSISASLNSTEPSLKIAIITFFCSFTSAVDRGIPDTLGKSQELLVKAITAEDFNLFTQEVQKFTSRELVKLYRDGVLENDFNYMLWSVCVTWGFQVHWAHLQIMAPEEIETMKQTSPYTDTEIPENFDSSIPLEQVRLWAPQDHMTKVQSA